MYTSSGDGDGDGDVGGGGGGSSNIEIDQTNETTSNQTTQNQNNTNTTTPTQNNTINQVNINVGNVTGNQTTNTTIDSNQTIITNLDLQSNTNLSKANLTIKDHFTKPKYVLTDLNIKNATIYKYVDINLTTNNSYIDIISIKNTKIKFKVEKSWIENESINQTNITLWRYHNNTWTALNTTYKNTDNEYVYYTAETPGFSTFAVVGSKIIESGQKNKETDKIPWSVIILIIVISMIVLFVILFKARYIYIEKEEK